MTDIFGQDILLDDAMQPVIAANGEPVLTVGVQTGVQDVRLRLFTRLGELFYDNEYGGLLHDWIREENTVAARAGFEAEVERCIQADPRVMAGTASCVVASWDEQGFIANATWRFIDADHPYNLVISIDTDKLDMVIKDVNPRTDL